MEERAVRGVVWTILSYGGNKFMTVLTTVILARILVPADFGLVALATLAVGFIGLFRDLGLGGALILRQDLDRAAQGTLLTLMLGMAAVVAAVVAAIAPLAAWVFDAPRLTGILAALSLTVILGAFGWFYDALLQRELEFRNRFYSQVLQSVVYAGVALGLAAAGTGAWSLVWGQIAASLAYAVMLASVAPYRVWPRFDRPVARDSLGTSKGFLLQGGLAFIEQNAAFFAVGRTLNTTAVGYWSMAYRMAELPYMAVADPVAKVTFPGFSRMRHRGEDVTPAFLSALRLVAVVTVPMGLLLSACAGPFTRVVLGDEWIPMIGALAVMGVWAAVRTVQVTIAWLLNSVGEAGLMGIISLWVLLPLIPGLLLGASYGGVEAVAWVMLADMVASLCVLSFFADRRGGVALARQWRAVRPVAIAAPGCWAAAWLAVQALEGAGTLPALLLGGLAGLGAYALALVLSERGLLRASFGQIGRTLGRNPSGAAT